MILNWASKLVTGIVQLCVNNNRLIPYQTLFFIYGLNTWLRKLENCTLVYKLLVVYLVIFICLDGCYGFLNRSTVIESSILMWARMLFFEKRERSVMEAKLQFVMNLFSPLNGEPYM